MVLLFVMGCSGWVNKIASRFYILGQAPRDIVQRKATFTRYELFAEFTHELQERIRAFCKSVDEFETKAISKAA